MHKQIAQGTEKKRVGFVIESGPSAREGTDVYLGENKIGTVSSGTFSPILKKAIGMAYIQSEFVKSKVGDQPSVKIRNKNVNITIAKMPFVETKYYK